MKTYKIECSFAGKVHYEINAETEENAKNQAKGLFKDEPDENLAKGIDRDGGCYTVIAAYGRDNPLKDFLDDTDKIRDLIALNKADFLASYSYLSEEEYDVTVKLISAMISDISLFSKSLRR